MLLRRYICCLVILGTILSSCSSTSRYKVLSFFFDGVSNPNDSASLASDTVVLVDTSGAVVALEITPAVQVNYHPPYRERKCLSCHDPNSMGKLRKPQPELCYSCHVGMTDSFSYLHGPVAAGYCTACHNPHVTKSKKLLLRSGQQICLYCHNSKMVFKNETHVNVGDRDCTQCHNPHGGANKSILK